MTIVRTVCLEDAWCTRGYTVAAMVHYSSTDSVSFSTCVKNANTVLSSWVPVWFCDKCLCHNRLATATVQQKQQQQQHRGSWLDLKLGLCWGGSFVPEATTQASFAESSTCINLFSICCQVSTAPSTSSHLLFIARVCVCVSSRTESRWIMDC